MTSEFWKSRTFWVVALGAVFNVLTYFGVVDAGGAETWINTILFVLGIIFRWVAQGPLTLSK
jgi:uncharacterized membrane protein YtjA (UPF0391 family)